MSARAKPATALPWGHTPQAEGERKTFVLSGADHIATCNSGHHSAQVCMKNAAYIVTACNAYPQLVAALRDLLVTVDLWERGAEESERGDPERNARALLRSLGEL